MIITKTAFCSKGQCCPTWSLDTDNNIVVIKDDFRGTVTMSVEQWNSLRDQASDAISELLVEEGEAMGLYA
jgi:hypothetical protein